MYLKIQHEITIIGSGISGLTAALVSSENCDVGVVSKVHALRSHSGAAQGGIAASLGNEEKDSWEWHMYDTVKGSDFLADQDMVEIFVKEAPRAVIALEHMGVPFNRNINGKIAQRPFGGHTRNFGEAPVKRACFASDRTGRVIMNTIYDRCLSQGVKIYNEYFVTELIKKNERIIGVKAYNQANSEPIIFHSKAVLLATGGCGRLFKTTSNGFVSTGDGFALAYMVGVPLQDMEFIQFHPTGLHDLGVLVTEAARGQGGILKNHLGEPFMERYAPIIKDLAPRDLVSRAIIKEIQEGRGINGEKFVHLDLTGIDKSIIEKDLSEVSKLAQIFLGINPSKYPIPVAPTCHYVMGGIPTDEHGKVVNSLVNGLFAVGECACVSVHGANRLGTNSLIDLVVFGQRAGNAISKYVKEVAWLNLNDENNLEAKNFIDNVSSSEGSEKVPQIRSEMQTILTDYCSIYRNREGLETAYEKIQLLKSRFKKIKIRNSSKKYNYELREAFELRNMLNLSEVIILSALKREESRGSHYRSDYPDRDDSYWLKHTLAKRTEKGIQIGYKPVSITRFQPEERKY